MGKLLPLIVLAAVALGAQSAQGAEETVLIQLQPDASYRVWYAEGQRRPSDDDLNRVSALATNDGSDVAETSSGPARAFSLPHGVMIAFADGRPDDRLLVDRDACGGVRVWHSQGKTTLSDNELTDLVLSALPDGGKRVALGDRYGKAFQTPLGVVAVIWAPPARH